MSIPPFHVAVPVNDIAAARKFYAYVLGCIGLILIFSAAIRGSL